MLMNMSMLMSILMSILMPILMPMLMLNAQTLLECVVKTNDKTLPNYQVKSNNADPTQAPDTPLRMQLP